MEKELIQIKSYRFDAFRKLIILKVSHVCQGSSLGSTVDIGGSIPFCRLRAEDIIGKCGVL